MRAETHAGGPATCAVCGSAASDRHGLSPGGGSEALRIPAQWRPRGGRPRGPQASQDGPPRTRQTRLRVGPTSRGRANRHGDQRWTGHGRTAEVSRNRSAWTGWPSPAERTGRGSARGDLSAFKLDRTVRHSGARFSRTMRAVRRATVRPGCWPSSPRSRSSGQRWKGDAADLARVREPPLAPPRGPQEHIEAVHGNQQ